MVNFIAMLDVSKGWVGGFGWKCHFDILRGKLNMDVASYNTQIKIITTQYYTARNVFESLALTG